MTAGRSRWGSGGAALYLALALAASPAAAQDVTFSGTVSSTQAGAVSGSLDMIESAARFSGVMDVSSDSSRARVEIGAEHNGVASSRSGLSLGEAWLEYDAGALALTIGRQVVAWGRADGVQVTDIVCPRDMTAFSALDTADMILPVDAVRARLSRGAWTLDALWIPVFTPTALPVAADNPLTAVARPSSATMGVNTVPVTYSIADTPLGLDDGEYAARLSYAGPALDASVCAFSGWDDLPRLAKTLSPEGLSVTGDWYRIYAIGADAGVPVGPVVLRFEGVVVFGRYFDAGLADAVREDQAVAMAGLDWTPGGWTVTAQYLEDVVLSRDAAMERAARKPSATLSVSRGFLRDALTLSAAGFLGLSDYDGYGSIQAEYALDDQLSVAVGSDIFWGGPDDDGGYESYEDLSSAFLRGTYRF